MAAGSIDDVGALRKRWATARRRKILNKLIGQRSFLDFAPAKEDWLDDPTLIKDFRGVDLSARDLFDFLLMNADIRWADFSRSRIEGQFQHTTLSYSSFQHTSLTGCGFWKAKLTHCKFDHAQVRRGIFEESDAYGASFRQALLVDTRFHSTDLRNVDFSGARLEGCVFEQVKLNGAERALWESHGAAQCRLEDVEWCEEALAD